MEQHFATVCGASSAVTVPVTQFVRIIILLLTSSLISITIALPSPSATNVDVLSSNTSLAAVANSSQMQAASSKHVVNESYGHRHPHRDRFHVSSYIRASLERTQKQQQNKEGHRPVHYVHLRKLSSNMGCISNPNKCLTMPGWTPTSNSSTCCPTTGFCTDTQFDLFNCGACGIACDFGYFCCSAVCVALMSDPNNCGKCGNVCKGGVCGFGFCNY